MNDLVLLAVLSLGMAAVLTWVNMQIKSGRSVTNRFMKMATFYMMMALIMVAMVAVTLLAVQTFSGA